MSIVSTLLEKEEIQAIDNLQTKVVIRLENATTLVKELVYNYFNELELSKNKKFEIENRWQEIIQILFQIKNELVITYKFCDFLFHYDEKELEKS